jgi:hypothetical protein
MLQQGFDCSGKALMELFEKCAARKAKCEKESCNGTY